MLCYQHPQALTLRLCQNSPWKLSSGFSPKSSKSKPKDLTGKIEASTDELAQMIAFLTKTSAHKTDLAGISEPVDKKFADQAVSLHFIESQLATLRTSCPVVPKEDDAAFVKDLLKLKNRMDQFEKQLKKLKTAHA